MRRREFLAHPGGRGHSGGTAPESHRLPRTSSLNSRTLTGPPPGRPGRCARRREVRLASGVPVRRQEGVRVLDKRVGSLEEAVRDVPDGATVLVGGFGNSGIPVELTHALLEQGARDLVVVTNNAGSGETDIAALLRERRVRKIICSYPRSKGSTWFEELYKARGRSSSTSCRRARCQRADARGRCRDRRLLHPDRRRLAARRRQGDPDHQRPPARVRGAAARRRRPHQGGAGGPVGQPRLPLGRPQLRPHDGDGRGRDRRPGAPLRGAGRARPGGRRDARDLREPRGAGRAREAT